MDATQTRVFPKTTSMQRLKLYVFITDLTLRQLCGIRDKHGKFQLMLKVVGGLHYKQKGILWSWLVAPERADFFAHKKHPASPHNKCNGVSFRILVGQDMYYCIPRHFCGSPDIVCYVKLLRVGHFACRIEHHVLTMSRKTDIMSDEMSYLQPAHVRHF